MGKLKLGKYKHYKGDFYHVLGIAKHSETQEELVIYRSLSHKDSLWVRPLNMFLEKIIVDGKEISRFEFVG